MYDLTIIIAAISLDTIGETLHWKGMQYKHGDILQRKCPGTWLTSRV